MREQIKKEFEE